MEERGAGPVTPRLFANGCLQNERLAANPLALLKTF